MKKSVEITLFVVFTLSLMVRIALSFETPFFSTPESYYHLRQIEHIAQSGRPLFSDELSYGGRSYMFLPAFYYVGSLFSLGGPWMMKLSMAVIAASVIFPLFFIVDLLTKNKKIALFIAALSTVTPAYMNQTVNTISPHILMVPLVLWFIYFFMKISSRRCVILALVTYAALAATYPFFSILIVALMGYYIINRIENLKPSPGEIELILFITVFTAWSYFVYFKKAFLLHSFRIIWQNIPQEVLQQYFVEFDVFTALYLIGIIPLFMGTYTLVKYLFKSKSKSLYLIISLNLTLVGLLWLQLIKLEVGLMYVSMTFLILLGKWMHDTKLYLEQTHFTRLKHLGGIALVLLLILTSVMPTVKIVQAKIDQAPSFEYIESLEWIRSMTPENATIAASLKEGHYITYFSHRKNIADTLFLMVPDAEERVADLATIFTTISKVKAVELLDKYDARYLLVSSHAKEEYAMSNIFYSNDPCFVAIFENQEAQIYENRCKVRTR